jgi:MFS family permease
MGSIVVLLAGSILLGAANAAVFLTRYAAAEIAGEAKRGRAIGVTFLATAIGAVGSPSLLGPSGAWARALGLPALSGLYLVAMVSFASAALLIAALSHPAVPCLGRAATLLGPSPVQRGSRARVGRNQLAAGLRATPARVALLVLALTNLIMVAVMAIAPVHLVQMTQQMQMSGMPAPTEQGSALRVTGVVVSLHVAGMFVPAPITGWLADRIGSVAVGLSGLVLLIVTGVMGMLISQNNAFSLSPMLLMLLMLITLGIGWNCGVVGGSVLLAASVPTTLRPHVEGIGEVAMGCAAALGAPAAGAVAAVGGIPALSRASAAMALFALAGAWLALRRGASGRLPNGTHPAPVPRTDARTVRVPDANG